MIVCFALRPGRLDVLLELAELSSRCARLLLFLFLCTVVIIRATTIQKTTTIGTQMINNIIHSAVIGLVRYSFYRNDKREQAISAMIVRFLRRDAFYRF